MGFCSSNHFEKLMLVMSKMYTVHHNLLFEDGKLVLLEKLACTLPQSRNSSGMIEEHNNQVCKGVGQLSQMSIQSSICAEKTGWLKAPNAT